MVEHYWESRGRGMDSHATCDLIHEGARGGRIYLAGSDFAHNRGQLEELGITRVVNCTFNIDPPGWLAQYGGPFRWMRFGITSLWRGRSRHGWPLLAEFSRLFDFVRFGLDAGEHTLVHCRAGAHRGGAQASRRS